MRNIFITVILSLNSPLRFSRPEFTLLVGPPVGPPEYLSAEIKLPGVVRYIHDFTILHNFFFSAWLNSAWIYAFPLGDSIGRGALLVLIWGFT